MRRHRLRREIIATVVANDMINLLRPDLPRPADAPRPAATPRALVTGFEAAAAGAAASPSSGRGWRRWTARRRPPARWRSSASWPASCAARPSGWPAAPARDTAGGRRRLVDAYRPAVGHAEGPGARRAVAVRAEGGGAARAPPGSRPARPRTWPTRWRLMRPLTIAAPLADLAGGLELAAGRRRPGSITRSAAPSASTGCARRPALAGRAATPSSGWRCAG